MKNNIKQLTIDECPSNYWRLNTDFLPPEGVQVLCCLESGEMWFDDFNNGKWSELPAISFAPTRFAWQLIASPSIF